MRIVRKFLPLIAGLAGGALLALGLFGYNAVVAQPGITPNFAFTRGAALGSNPGLSCQGLDTNVGCNIITQGTGVLQVNGTAVALAGGTVASFTVNPGPLTVVGTSNLTGPVFQTPGSSAVLKQDGAVVLNNASTSATTTLVATEQDLFNFSVIANVLSANNQYLVLTAKVRNAATANAKQTRVYFGATLIGDSTSVASNNNWHMVECIVWRTGAATQKAICNSSNLSNAASWSSAAGGGANISTPAETLSGAVTMRLTGTDAVAAGGTVLEAYNLVWYPAGQ